MWRDAECPAADEGSVLLQNIFSPADGVARAKRKRKKKRRRVLYDQYLADSGSECSTGSSEGGGEVLNAYEFEEFEPGMDINILIQQTVQNVAQSVSLEDYDGLSQFGDYDLICFAAAVKHNSSILSLQIRYLDVSDVSLVPLCRALEGHPCIRALDLSGTRGGNATIKAVFRLVCTNPNILFVRLDDTMVASHDAGEIELATRYNALGCPDPTNNPFHFGLLRKIGDMEEEKQKYKEQLSAHSWLFSDHTGGAANQATKKTKKFLFAEKVAKSRIGADVCAQFMSGRCNYGSRCRYIHPDKTAALQNAITLSQYKISKELEGDVNSLRTCATLLSSGSKMRLQSRLRPAKFALKEHACSRIVAEPKDVDSCSEVDDFSKPNVVWAHAVWIFSVTVVVCSVVVAVTY
ncbi:Present in the outer mitochondrial membrane proteome 35 [Trypanosoma cruzi]|uniref:Present in the outer mitochondrial membrane proteome 35 n=1 Tax=Trypanosoma cruzi TaxID=5693 RepID=A0A7J6Y2E7_TRYCR|nr:Present in the outer mitochondrial membrane proteome 35 [Trypanosoma cruzi]